MNAGGPPPVRSCFDGIFRAEWGRLVATLIRTVGDIDRAEELVQEALVSALEHWPREGVPRNPGAWLLTTARNRAIDHLRRERRAREKQPLLEADWQQAADPAEEPALPGRGMDDRLRLIFTCCHPALPPEGRLALTLRLLGGLSTREIAAAFLVSEATAAQRVVRAKRSIRERRLPFRVPDRAELPGRLSSVLEVIYPIFRWRTTPGSAPTRSFRPPAPRRLGRHAEALPDFRRALALCANTAERRHLERRIADCLARSSAPR